MGLMGQPGQGKKPGTLVGKLGLLEKPKDSTQTKKDPPIPFSGSEEYFVRGPGA